MSAVTTQSTIGTEPISGDRLQEQLRMVTIAWLFGSAWMWTINGATMTQFARQMGTPDWGFGILAMLPFVGTFFQLPASYLLERYGHRKRVFLVAASLSRLLWAVAAAVPWLMPHHRQWWWPTMAGLLAMSWITANLSGPAWMNWMSDLIPRRIRGRYFALRNNVGNSIGLIVTLAIGYALDQTEQAVGSHTDLMLRVTSAMLAIAGLMGTLDILCFRGVVDPVQPRPDAHVSLRAMFRGPLGDSNFRRYLLFMFVFHFGTAFIGQYVWLYVFDVLQWTNKQANFLLVAVALVVRLLSFRPWGRLTDRLGKKPVILISGFCTIFGATGWLLCTRENWWVGYATVVMVMLAWPGFEIATFNFILDLAGSKRHAATGGAVPGGGSAYVALNSLTVAIAGILSGLFAGAIAGWLKDWPTAPIYFGITLTYHGVLFFISTVLRAVAVFIAIGLSEPHVTAPREVVRIMAGEFYSNVQRMRMMPVQLAGQVMRWTYRLGNGPESASPRKRSD